LNDSHWSGSTALEPHWNDNWDQTTATGATGTTATGDDRTTATAGATDTGAYESKLQKLLELRATDRGAAVSDRYYWASCELLEPQILEPEPLD